MCEADTIPLLTYLLSFCTHPVLWFQPWLWERLGHGKCLEGTLVGIHNLSLHSLVLIGLLQMIFPHVLESEHDCFGDRKQKSGKFPIIFFFSPATVYKGGGMPYSNKINRDKRKLWLLKPHLGVCPKIVELSLWLHWCQPYMGTCVWSFLALETWSDLLKGPLPCPVESQSSFHAPEDSWAVGWRVGLTLLGHLRS